MAGQHSRFDLIKGSWWQYLLIQAVSLVMRTGSSFAESSLSSVFLPADGQCGPFKFIDLCVTDSLLMAFYCCYFKFEEVRSLFNICENIRAAMVFVGAGMYNEAKACWLFTQFDMAKNSIFHFTAVNKEFLPYFEVNARSEPKDHLQIFNELVLGTYHFDKDGSTSGVSQDVLSNTLSKFQDLGDVHAWGITEYNPVVIVVNVDRRLDKAPSLTVYDDYGRVFELQFLVMTRKSHPEHVVAGLHLFNGWVLYDDLKTGFGDFSPWNADFKDDFIILLAGYVNTGQVPFGVPEEGRYGPKVFNPARHFTSHDKDHQD